MTFSPKGLQLQGPRGPIRLKWHRLRRTAGDVDFTAGRLREGLALGASMEIDLRRHADDGFVCLHDALLDRETSGRGAIALTSVVDLRGLRMRGPDGHVTGEPLLLLDDLVEIAASADRDAIVQFDLKEHLTDLDTATLVAFERLVRPKADRFVLSGDDWAAVCMLGDRIAGLRLGFDPSDLPEARGLKSAKDFSGFTRFALEAAPEADIIYLEYRLVLAALAGGFDIVAALQAGGRAVDAWTLDATAPKAMDSLARLIASGVDQISTNDSLALQDAAEKLAA